MTFLRPMSLQRHETQLIPERYEPSPSATSKAPSAMTVSMPQARLTSEVCKSAFNIRIGYVLQVDTFLNKLRSGMAIAAARITKTLASTD